MKFLSDSMLGRLTRWLRLSGYDVFYASELDDKEILAKAKAEGRIICTRDKRLAEKAEQSEVPVVYLESNELLAQLRQLRRELDIVVRDEPVEARCPMCNSEVTRVARDEVADKVPSNVLSEVNDFWACGGCGKVYWRGGHWKRIKDMVERL